MKALVGLGNPGPEYEWTRHNVGFLALDEAARLLGLSGSKKQHKGLVMEGWYKSQKVLLFKPTTYMNLSGQALVELMHFYKLEPEDLLIFSDDIDLLPGMMRLRIKGGAGTHNGWRSILQETGSDRFPRIRIGVGAPPEHWDLADWVLSSLGNDQQLLHEACALAAEAAECFIHHGIDLAMNRYNKRDHA